jgi:hypothetical protein
MFGVISWSYEGEVEKGKRNNTKFNVTNSGPGNI